MNRFRRISTSLCSLLYVLTLSGVSLATVTDPLTTINIKTPIHFIAPDGSPMVVPSDIYSVEAAEDWLRLVPGERHDAVLIEAKKGAHELELTDALALSVTGTEDDSQDLHHVILLLPDGVSLESTGTYSGIRPRGFFDRAVNNVKKQTNQAYKKARSTAKKTVSQVKSTAGKATNQARQQTQKAVTQAKKGAQSVGKQARKGTQQAVGRAKQGVQTARNAALQAKRQIEQTGRRIGGAVQSGVQAGVQKIQNNPLVAKLQSEIQTLEAVRKLKLEPLFLCLAQASGKTSANIANMVNQLTTNPPGFANWLLSDLMQKWEQSFGEIMAEQLQMIRNPSNTRLQGPQVVDMAFKSMDRLAQKSPGGKCLMQFVRPQLQAFKKTSGQLQKSAMAQGKRIFDSKVAPILFSSLNKQIGEMFETLMTLTPQDNAQSRVRSRGIDATMTWQGELILPDEQIVSRGLTKDQMKELFKDVVSWKELKVTVQAVMTEHLLNPSHLHRAATHVESLSKSLNDSNQRAKALSDVQSSLDPNLPWTEALYIDIGTEMLRVVGKNYIDSDIPGGGSFLIHKAVATLNLGEQTVGTVVQSVAGLVPEVGGIVSGLVKISPDAVWQLMLSDIIIGGVKLGLHTAFNVLIDTTQHTLKTGKPYEAIKRNAGPLSGLVQYLPSKKQIILLAEKHTKETRIALDHYNRSVMQLAEAAAQ